MIENNDVVEINRDRLEQVLSALENAESFVIAHDLMNQFKTLSTRITKSKLAVSLGDAVQIVNAFLDDKKEN